VSLEDDVRDLSERVRRIEQALSMAPTASVAAAPEADVQVENTAGTSRLPFVLGRALLGLAGAYLLRALTEGGTMPAGVGVAAGIAYAILWMVWAARTAAAERVEIALHSLTAVLVLAPLLWEAVTRFCAVSTWTAGAILLFFTVFGLAISWRKDILILATIATLAGLGTAGGLLIATHDVVPFTLVFLAIGAAVEVSACLEHWLSERWLAASAADLAVLLATWLVTNERGVPPNYAPIPHGALLAALVLLLAIYLSSTIVRTLLRGFTFTFFETAQCGIALAITLNGCLRLSAEDPRIAPAVGTMALLCAAACYVVSFVLLDRKGSRGRNFYTYSTFGILLAVAGTRILLSLEAVSALWLGMAAACSWAGAFYRRFTLQLHGAIYLGLALVFLGVLQASAESLLGTVQWSGEMQLALAGGAIAATVCYTHCGPGMLRLALAGALALILAGVAAASLTFGYHAAFGVSASQSYCATIRTCLLAGSALLLGWAGARWRRVELSRLIYPAMLVAAYRLIADDMRQERKAAAVISLLVYGVALMMLPRLNAMRRPAATSTSAP